MSLLLCSLTASALECQEPTVWVKCTIRTDTGLTTKGTLVSLHGTLSDQGNSIGSALVEMLSSLQPTDTDTTASMVVGDDH